MATAEAGANAVKRAAGSPMLRLLERLGYASRGALYAVMGLLALGIALRVGGQTTDLSGSLAFAAANPFGKVLLVVMAVGLTAYSLWGFIRAIYDPLHRGRDASGYMARLGFVTSAVSYAALVILAVQLLSGSGGASGDGTKTTISTVLSPPTSRSVRATRLSAGSAGWQHVKTSRSRSSGIVCGSSTSGSPGAPSATS